MKSRLLIAGALLILAAALVFAFTPAHSALADLANRGDEPCVTKVRSKDNLRDLEEKAFRELEKAGLTREQAREALDPSFFAANEVSCTRS
jgi:hypothetical protein